MALYLPTMTVPDVRSGLGFGTVDVDGTWNISWRVNGPSAMVAFQITIYTNDAASTQLYTTGRITDGCPFYGTSPIGEPQTFSYTMPAISYIANGESYKYVIEQWWSASDSVVQNSASVFLARSTPSLYLDPIGTITGQTYTFTGIYAQQEGDALNWFRWELANADNLGETIYDTGNVSGTMDLTLDFDGLFTGQEYAIRLTAQTQSGVFCDTGWTTFDVDYGTPIESEQVKAVCAKNTNAVIVSWFDDMESLITPEQVGVLTYNGATQTPAFINYDPTKMTMSGVTSGVNAGTYTAVFTPLPGYGWANQQYSGVTDWAIYRLGDGQFVHLADVPNTNGVLYDYGVGSRQGPYTYYAFPLNDSVVMGSPLQSNTITPCFYSWSLMECAKNGDGSYTVLTEYLFKYNFASGSILNNNRPTLEKNFTRYPTLFKAPQNYRSGSLSYLIGTIDRQAKYSDTLSLRQRLFQLSTTKNDLFLKSRKGDVIRVAVTNPISVQIADATFEQTQSVTIEWAELGEIGSLLRLVSLGDASASDDPNSPNLRLNPSSVAGLAGDTFTITATWNGPGTLSVNAPQGVNAIVNGRTITVTKSTVGKVAVPVTVNAAGGYNAQTVMLNMDTADVGNNYLRFSSASAFTVGIRGGENGWDGLVYYRAGSGDWQLWNGANPISSANGTVDLRGVGNTVFTGGPTQSAKGFVFTGSNISCTGNVESLLDYRTVAIGGHPAMAALCFNKLFYNCTTLVSAPTLGALSLSLSCYYEMFSGCTGLTTPPALPAKTLEQTCYFAMFENSGLTKLPKLPARVLATWCYNLMFSGCSGVKVAQTNASYTYEWRIPTAGTGTGTDNTSGMLTGTFGPFTGDPQLNTVYYTDAQPV